MGTEYDFLPLHWILIKDENVNSDSDKKCPEWPNVSGSAQAKHLREHLGINRVADCFVFVVVW